MYLSFLYFHWVFGIYYFPLFPLKYLNGPTTSPDSTPQDKENFDKLIKAMDNIGMTAEEKGDLFRVTAAVLHLGNILFEDDTSQKGFYDN